jgi:hypothetical protein
MVRHSWGSALTHHPHVHCIVPGGGLSLDGQSWIWSRPRYLLPMPALASLYRRLMCERLAALHGAGKLVFFGVHAALAYRAAFQAFLRPLRQIDWVVYAKAPFAGPDSVLRYLARYTHRVAIANSRLISFEGARVTFRYKDYRADGGVRKKIMTVSANEFIRRFLPHVLPTAFIGSGTTASWPTACASLPSPRHARCSPSPHQKKRRVLTKRPRATRPRRHAHAAVGG